MGKGAPRTDPNIGVAAREQAQLGRQYLAFMQGQSEITNAWAEEDRARDRETFRPIQDQYIADALGYDTPERRQAAVSEAVADVRQQSAIARASTERRLASMGVDPTSGRGQSDMRRDQNAEALAAAGAGNLARKQVEATGEGRRANAINMGAGLAVNPATSMGLSNGAVGSGFSGAMQGNGQMISALQGQQDYRMQAWQSQVGQMNSLFSGIGMAAGAFLSDENAKTGRKKARRNLDAIRSLDIDEWDYKPGRGDGGHHVGPMAQDFQRETGLGNGREINVQDALGVTMGAVKEIADRLDRITGKGKQA